MEEQSSTPRRTLFRRLEHHEDEPLMTSSEHRISASLRRSIDGQLEEGLRALEEQATELMREIAAEIWRASGNDMRPEQERIVSLLSRDQTVKTLIASSDERFQALALRSARVEDSMNEVAESGRTSRDAIEASLLAIREIADSPTLHGVEQVRTQLEQVEHHIAAALATMQERDRAIVETVTQQVQAHGQLLTEETAKVIGAIDAYVQTGAEALGTLSQRVEEHAEAFAVHDGTISQTVADRVATELAPVAEQLEMLAEQVGLHGRDQEQVRTAIERLVEARIMGVARLIRADSEALQALIEERTEVQVDTIRETVDWRMAAFAERIDEKLGSVAEEIAATITERMDTGVGAIDGGALTLAEGQARGRGTPAGAHRRPHDRDRPPDPVRQPGVGIDGARAAGDHAERAARRGARSPDAASDQGAAGRARRRDGDQRRREDPLDQRSAAQGDPVDDRVDGEGRRGAGREDRPPDRARRRGRRQRHAGRDRSHDRRDPGDVGDAPQRLSPRGSDDGPGFAPALVIGSARCTVASPRLIGHSVSPSRSLVTQSSTVAVRVSASIARTRPPATISCPIETVARNCAEIAETAAASPAHATTQAAM